jgi:type IV pilus assembly protein PilY1
MKAKLRNLTSVTFALVMFGSVAAQAQTVTYSENFTGGSTNNSWYYFNGACLTAGTTAATVVNVPGSASAVAGVIPSCVSMLTGSFYYNVGNAVGEPLVGGTSGTIPGTDPTIGGALRFTNVPTNGSYPQGFQESGAILSNFSFPLSSQGIQVTFVTETYEGDSGGGDGADGISFFLQDASAAPDLGATGGSLAYSCTNVNNDNTHFRTTGRARGYDGLPGAYVGVGIDEYGNFLNGSNSVAGLTPTSNADNTASGASNVDGGTNFQGNRIGIRGAGYVTWGWLNANYPTHYLTSFTNDQASAAVQATCATGYVQNYNATSGSFSPAVPLIAVPDYPALAYSNVPSVSIANESAIYRGNGTSSQLTSQYGVPISYTLKITTAGLLTLSYSYDGGAAISVISGYNITANNGALPANVRFGFAGSDGGATNIHEVMCFQAAPQTTSQSSAAGNQKQSAPVVTGTQVYFSYYDPTTWAGSVASDSLLIDSNNNVFIASTANWDASCVLTGIPSGSTCQKTGVAGSATTTAPTPASRVALTWNYSPTTGNAGIPFAWSSLSAVEQTAIDAGDPNTPTGTPTGTTYQPYRVSYLLGDRGNEQTAAGTGEYSGNSTPYPPYRARASVLGDIIDSSPTWVGPPISGYPNAWTDKYDGGTMLENSGQTYGAFTTQEMSRTNVVFAGANDGFLHGFRSGYYDSSGNYVGTGSGSSFVGTQNDGAELLAYMPGYVLSHIQTGSSVTTVNGTTTVATTANSATNYSDPQYGHQFDVDATPGTGDVFYNGLWHTVLVGGLGAGGPGIFALDITNPENSSLNATTYPTFSTPTFSTIGTSSGATANPANTGIVIGDWSTTTTTTTTNTLTNCHINGQGIQHCTSTPSTSTATSSTLICTHTTGSGLCGLSLGNTYGTPQIRRFHNGQWGAVFGNGFGSSTGDAGIYVMLLNTSTGAPTFYYLSTGKSGTSDGIGYVSTADLDGDHITDYVYAGDLLGNIWRFDLTSTDPTRWAVTSIPVFTTATGQPITSKLSIISVLSTPARRVMVAFGTGREFPLSITGAASFLTTQQSLYGIWDWNLATWNSNSTTQYAVLPYGGVAAPTSGITAGSLTPSNLQAQSMAAYSIGGLDYRTVTSNAVCWAGTTGCTGGTTAQYGWYLPLTYGYANPADVDMPLSSSTNPPVYEQVIYNPILIGDTFIVNTVIPSAASLINCFSVSAGGFTMAIDPSSGGSFAKPVIVPPANVLPPADPTNYNGVGVGGTGTGFVVTSNPACTGSSCTSCTGSGCTPPCTGPTCAAPPACTPGTNNFIVTQTVSGTPTTVKFNPQCNTVGSRQTWIQRR